MKKVLRICGFLVSVVLVTALFFSIGSQDVFATTPFVYKSFDGVYTLSRDAGTNVSRLKADETVVAEFRASGNQNHGIDWVVPNRIKAGDGMSWRIDTNITSMSGGPYTVATRDRDNDFVTVRIGDRVNTVHGLQTYNISWTARDVVFPNSILLDKTPAGDEFAWMVNNDGTDQSSGMVTATVNIVPELVPYLDGRVICLNNEIESQCSVASSTLSDGTKQFVFTGLTETHARQTLFFDIGFKPETFAFPANFYKSELAARGFSIFRILIIALVALSPVIIYLLYRLHIALYNKKKINSKPILPQFVVPDFATLSECEVFWSDKNLMAPILLDLAVRGYITVVADQKGRPSGFVYNKPADESLKDPASIKILNHVFSGKNVGDQVLLKDLKASQSLGAEVHRLQKAIQVSQFGDDKFYKGKPKKASSGLNLGVIMVIAIFAFPIIAPFLVGVVGAFFVELLPFAIPIIVFIVLFGKTKKSKNRTFRQRKLTDKGADLQRYLLGLREFMNVSEADRIKMMQSPNGAEKVGAIVGGNKVKLIKLYEQLLPFASIFGIEKKWGQTLQVYYNEVHYTPNFYHGYVSGYLWGNALGSLSTVSRSLSTMEATRIARQTAVRSASWSSGGSRSSGFGGGRSFGGGGGGGRSGW